MYKLLVKPGDRSFKSGETCSIFDRKYSDLLWSRRSGAAPINQLIDQSIDTKLSAAIHLFQQKYPKFAGLNFRNVIFFKHFFVICDSKLIIFKCGTIDPTKHHVRRKYYTFLLNYIYPTAKVTNIGLIYKV